MASFENKLEDKKNAYPYYLGAKAYSLGLAMDSSPYTTGSKLDEEWVDGYLDSLFLGRI